MTKNFLSQNLKFLLQQQQLSTAELARRCGLAQPVLHRVVVGEIVNPQINTLLPVADYFQCSLDKLLLTDLAQQENGINIDGELNMIRHHIRNTVAIINATLMGLQKMLPILIESYYVLPKEVRSSELSDEALSLLPKILEQALARIVILKEDVNKLKG